MKIRSIVTLSMWSPTKKLPLIAACKRVREKDQRDRITHSQYCDQLLRLGLISQTQRQQASMYPTPQFKVQDICQFCLRKPTRWLGIEIKSPKHRCKRRYHELYAVAAGVNMEGKMPAEYAFMCKECFQLTQWHVKHKWNVITHLWHCMPQVPRDLWRYIAELTWET